MAARRRRRRSKKKKIEASKRLAYWAAIVASVCPIASYTLAARGLDPVSDLTSTIFTACIGYLITYAAKSLGKRSAETATGSTRTATRSRIRPGALKKRRQKDE